MDIRESLRDIPKTLRNIRLSNQRALFSMDITWDGNAFMLARAFRVTRAEAYFYGEANLL